jgi:cytochrome b561
MQWTNSVERYGAVARFFHWTIGILILGMLVMGTIMGDIPNGPDKFWVYSIHKATGITILALVVLRLIWKLINWNLPRDLNHPAHEHWLSTFVHWGFYALMIGMPLSGWALTSAANSTINWYGFFSVPKITVPDQNFRDAMEYAHETIATLLWVFIGLHVAGVIKHLVIDKDSTLRRMVPFMKPAIVLFLMAATPAMAQQTSQFPNWTIDRAKSTLTIQATQEGSAFDGRFTGFDGLVVLDPAKPETGNAKIIIDLGSFDSKNGERDGSVKGPDWFDIATMPTAAYTISKFEKSGKDGNGYLATGILRLRGIEKPLDLPFTMTITEKDGVKTAHCVGSTTLKRLDFGVGGGQWADPSMVGDAVVVSIDLTMVAAAPK